MNSGADDDVPSPAAASSRDSASKSPRRSKNKLDRWVLKLKADEQRKRDALDAATVPRDAARGGVAAAGSDQRDTVPTSHEAATATATASTATDDGAVTDSKLARWRRRAASREIDAAIPPKPPATCEVPAHAAEAAAMAVWGGEQERKGLTHDALSGSPQPLLQADVSMQGRAGSKASRWAARAGQAAAAAQRTEVSATTSMPAASTPATTTSAVEMPAARSKIERWKLRAAATDGGGNVQAVAGSVAAVAESNTLSISVPAPAAPDVEVVPFGKWKREGGGEEGAMQDPAQVAALGLTQGFRDGTMRHVWAQVVSGTAMEAWMKQAAAKQLHVPSRQKRWDFIDEAAQQKRGYSAAQVSAQRRHLNPPDRARLFSSVKDAAVTGSFGRGFGRSRLDSGSAWVAAKDVSGEWLILDLGRVMAIRGLVTQSHFETGKKKDQSALETAYVRRLAVEYKEQERDQWVRMSAEVELGHSGNARLETPFAADIDARFLKLVVLEWSQHIVLRVGVLLPQNLEAVLAEDGVNKHGGCDTQDSPVASSVVVNQGKCSFEDDVHKLRAFYRKHNPAKEPLAEEYVRGTPGYPDLKVLNDVLHERYGDNLHNRAYWPDHLLESSSPRGNAGAAAPALPPVATPQPPQPAQAPASTKTERWKLRAAAAAEGGGSRGVGQGQEEGAAGAGKTQAAVKDTPVQSPVLPSGALSKAERWKQRAAAGNKAAGGSDQKGADRSDQDSGVAAPARHASMAGSAAATAPVSKAERWKLRVAAGQAHEATGTGHAAMSLKANETAMPQERQAELQKSATQARASDEAYENPLLTDPAAPAPPPPASSASLSKADRWKQRAAAAAQRSVMDEGEGGEGQRAAKGSKAGRWAARAAAAAAPSSFAPSLPPVDVMSRYAAVAAASGLPDLLAPLPAKDSDAAAKEASRHAASGSQPSCRDTLPCADRRPFLDPCAHSRLGSWDYLDPDASKLRAGGSQSKEGLAEVTYVQIQREDFKYSGWVTEGVPHISGSMWFASGHEYQGSIHMGKPHGDGKHFFADGASLECFFEDGCPKGAGLLIDAYGQHWNVSYAGGQACQDGAVPEHKEETQPEPFRPTKSECVALTIGAPLPVPGTEHAETGKPKLAGNFPTAKDVKARLVWARPPFADMPLWNAEKVRGQIVAIVRGPAAPATAVSYGLKLHHAQEAGAKAVVFVDYDPNGKFDAMPRVDEGLVTYGVRPVPADVQVKARIPCALVLNRHTTALQEGAQHVLAFAPPDFPGVPYGWKVGFVCVPPQESKVGLSKAKADVLMAEFFAERKKERFEEGQMLKDDKDSGKDQAEEALKGREFYGGNFFDSLNPLKQVRETANVDDKVRVTMLNSVRRYAKNAGLDDSKIEEMRSKVEKMQQDFTQKMPVMNVTSLSAKLGIGWDEEQEAGRDGEGEYSLAAWRRKAGIKLPKWIAKAEEEAAASSAVSSAARTSPHGVERRKYTESDDGAKGCFIVEHNPYMPCIEGAGKRWLYHDTRDDAALAQKRLASGLQDAKTNVPLIGDSLDDSIFFDMIKESESRACKPAYWPAPMVHEHLQDAYHGYHVLKYKDALIFSGYLDAGVPDGHCCSLRWLHDKTEYHGEMTDGELTGFGRYIFADGGEFRGIFRRGFPTKGFYLAPDNQPRVLCDFGEVSERARLPIWQLEGKDLYKAQTQECPLPAYVWTKADCVALVRANPLPMQPGEKTPRVEYDYKHLREVTARLVWARPIHADQPLWNADECRGKIVAVLRGPRAPAPACNYSVKLFYCQDAGAVGVIFVDWDPTGRFTIMPRVENGPIFPGGPSLTVGIPAMFTLYAYSGALQEGALHTMMVAPPNCVGVPDGWRIGFLFCRRQESRRGMSKEKADQLLNDFFSSRRAERLEEQDLLQDQLDHLRHGVDDLDKKEFMAGSVLDSMNPLKQSEETPAPAKSSGTLTKAMLASFMSPGEADLAEKKADAAVKILGGLMHGALATMTGEAGASSVLQTSRRNTTEGTRGSSSTACSAATVVRESKARGAPSACSQPESASSVAGSKQDSPADLARQREELASLSAKIAALELENRQLRQSQPSPSRTPANTQLDSPASGADSSTSGVRNPRKTDDERAGSIFGSSLFSTPKGALTASLFSSWTASPAGGKAKSATPLPENQQAPAAAQGTAAGGYRPKASRPAATKPEWL